MLKTTGRGAPQVGTSGPQADRLDAEGGGNHKPKISALHLLASRLNCNTQRIFCPCALHFQTPPSHALPLLSPSPAIPLAQNMAYRPELGDKQPSVFFSMAHSDEYKPAVGH